MSIINSNATTRVSGSPAYILALLVIKYLELGHNNAIRIEYVQYLHELDQIRDNEK